MRQPRHDSPRRNDSIRAAIYTRISFDDTGREEGVERQEHDCRAWADAHGWPVVKVFCDNSISASKFDVMRPEYDKLCDAVSSGEVNAVVYWDLDRLTRQQGQLEWWLNQSKRGRVRMADPKGGELVADTAEQRLTISMRGLFSYFEVEHKSERQVAANRGRARNGRLFTGSRPLGLKHELFLDDDGELRVARVIPEEAEVVRAVYRAFLEGNSLDAIARALSGDDEPTMPYVPTYPRPAYIKMLEFNERHPDRPIDVDALRKTDPKRAKHYDPQPWGSATVRLMLRNPKYAGYVGYTPTSTSPKSGNGSGKWYSEVYIDEETGKPARGAWDAIIDPDTWWQVQARLAKSAERVAGQAAKTRKHVGSSIYRCGVCGHTLHIQGGKGGSYVCPTNRRHPRVEGEEPSGPVCVLARALDPIVEGVVERYLARPEVARGIDTRKRPTPSQRDFEAEIRHQNELVEQARRDYANGDIEAADLKARRIACEERVAEIRRDQRAEAEAMRAPELPTSVMSAPDPARAFREADLATRRAVVDFLIDVRVMPTSAKGGTRGGRHGGWFDPSRIRIAAKTPDGPVPIDVGA